MGVRVQLFGGEKDGDRMVLDIPQPPDLIYACRACDDKRVWKARGANRTKLLEELSVLAYQLNGPNEASTTGEEYRYDRAPSRDKQPRDVPDGSENLNL